MWNVTQGLSITQTKTRQDKSDNGTLTPEASPKLREITDSLLALSEGNWGNPVVIITLIITLHKIN